MNKEQIIQMIIDEVQELEERKKLLIKTIDTEVKEQNKYTYLLEGRYEGRLCEIDGNIIFLHSLLEVLNKGQ